MFQSSRGYWGRFMKNVSGDIMKDREKNARFPDYVQHKIKDIDP